MRFLLRRLLHSLVLLVGTSMLSFLLINLAPGDFFQAMRMNPNISPATVAALRSQHGLDRPLPFRYVQWAGSILKGDWGFSFAYNGPARPLILSRAENTLLLAITATILAWITALPLGIWAAVKRGRWADWITGSAISVLLATPELVLGLSLLLFAVRTGFLPTGGMSSPVIEGSTAVGIWQQSGELVRHLILPSVCLAAGLLPMIFSHVRGAVAEALQSSAVSAAHGYGIPFRRVLFRFAVPAAANPLISLLGLSLGVLMSSSLLVEVIFSWPGLGQTMVEAILQRDIFLVLDAGLVATAFYVAGNLASDILLYASDPRIRMS